jgi:hypothetical protein
LTPSSPHHPAGLVSYRRHSWGSPFRGFPFRSPGRLSAPLAPRGVSSSTFARQVMLPEHRVAVARVLARSVIRVAARRPRPAPVPDCSGEGSRRRARGRGRFRARLQGFQLVSEVRTPVGGCYPARWEPILSWDFQPSRGLPLPALTRPLAENASIFGSCDRVSPRALRVGVRTGRSRTLQGLDRRGGRLVSLETTAPPGVPVLVLGAGGG